MPATITSSNTQFVTQKKVLGGAIGILAFLGSLFVTMVYAMNTDVTTLKSEQKEDVKTRVKVELIEKSIEQLKIDSGIQRTRQESMDKTIQSMDAKVSRIDEKLDRGFGFHPSGNK